MLCVGKVWCRCGRKLLRIHCWTFSFKYKIRYLCGDVGLTVGYKNQRFRSPITMLEVKSGTYQRDGILKAWDGTALTSEYRLRETI